MTKACFEKRLALLEQAAKPRQRVMTLDEFYKLPESERVKETASFYPEPSPPVTPR